MSVVCTRGEQKNARACHIFPNGRGICVRCFVLSLQVNACKLVTKERALGEIWGSHGFGFKDTKPCNLEDTSRSSRRTWCLSGSSERSLLVYHFSLTMEVADSSAISVHILSPTRKETNLEPCRRRAWFQHIETRAVIKFFFCLQDKAPREIHAILTETLACFLPRRAKELSASLEQVCMPSPRANLWMKNQKCIAVCVGR